MARVQLLAALTCAGAGFATAACNTSQVASADDCPSGSAYSSVTGKCYFIKSSGTFQECMEICGDASGTLATISSKEVNGMVYDLLDYGQWAWIGLYQDLNASATSGWDNWMNGCSTNYRNWALEPDDWCGLNEMCAFMKNGQEDGFDLGEEWQDSSCDNQISCMCEYPSSADSAYLEVADDLEDDGDLSDECAKAVAKVLGIMFIVLAVIPTCCCCCCVCGIAYCCYQRSKNQQRQAQMAAGQGQPQIMGQPVVGTVVG